MSENDFDDGLIHNHRWAEISPAPADRQNHPKVADAASVPTPSSVIHDETHD